VASVVCKLFFIAAVEPACAKACNAAEKRAKSEGIE
jgi:hypothetical protein